MKEFNKMEKSIYEIMEGFEVTPSVAQKDIFLKNVLQKKASKRRKRFGLILFALLSCLVALSSIFFINHDNSETLKAPVVKNSNCKTSNTSSGSCNETPKADPNQNTVSEVQSIEKESVNRSKTNPKTNNSVSTEQIVPKNEIISVQSVSTVQNVSTTNNQSIVNSNIVTSNITINEPTTTNSETEEIPFIDVKEDQNLNTPTIELNKNKSEDVVQTQVRLDTNKSEVPVNEPNKTKKITAFNRVFIQELESSVGIYYRPEMIYNIIENDKYIHNFGVEFKFHPFNPRYEIRTGFGLSVSKGYYEYQVDYNQYLGSYNSLDSVSFTVADNGFNLVPEYHFSNADVYNDYLSTYYTKIYRQHIYLQIPLEMGYDFVKTKKNAIGFRVGPTLSILMNQKPINLQFDAGKDKVVQINRITPDRISANWQLMGGLNFAHSLDHFIFEIEPRITYYFNSVYEKNDLSSSPYSINIRFAVGLK